MAMMLGGTAREILYKDVAPVVLVLRDQAIKLKKRFLKDQPLPPASTLHTLQPPSMEEPMRTLMELLSPEFPELLTGSPFNRTIALDAVDIDRSVEAFETVRLAVRDFNERGQEAIRRALNATVWRRRQIVERHKLQHEILAAANDAAMLMELVELGGEPDRQVAERELTKIARARAHSTLAVRNILDDIHRAELRVVDGAARSVLALVRNKIAVETDWLAQVVEVVAATVVVTAVMVVVA